MIWYRFRPCVPTRNDIFLVHAPRLLRIKVPASLAASSADAINNTLHCGNPRLPALPCMMYDDNVCKDFLYNDDNEAHLSPLTWRRSTVADRKRQHGIMGLHKYESSGDAWNVQIIIRPGAIRIDIHVKQLTVPINIPSLTPYTPLTHPSHTRSRSYILAGANKWIELIFFQLETCMGGFKLVLKNLDYLSRHLP